MTLKDLLTKINNVATQKFGAEYAEDTSPKNRQNLTDSKGGTRGSRQARH